MPSSLARRSVDWLMRSKRQKLEIQFFGGEPTSEWNTLIDTLNYARTHAQRQDRALEFVITTNGLTLTKEKVEALSHPDVLILFSLDGTERAHQRFRAPYRGEDASSSFTHDTAWQQLLTAVELLNDSEIRWFMNAVIPPADAKHLMDRYQWALNNQIPALQLNYAVGMQWPEKKVNDYLEGLIAVMERHRTDAPDMVLYNWRSECEPVMLSDDLIVDVDGLVLHDGAIFLERGFPELRDTYRRGPLETLEDFDSCRWSLAKLCAVMCQTYAPDSNQHQTVLQNIRMGAAVDWVIQALREIS